ncbi:MAG: hypothetical protein V2A76_18620 [Planctomycetota bacterium]
MASRSNRASFERASHRWRMVAPSVVLALLLPVAAVHGFLFHGPSGAECSHQSKGPGNSLCGDGVFPHETDSCGLCAVSWRWVPGGAEAPRRVTAPPLGIANLSLNSSLWTVSTDGTLGPRAPPASL